MYDPNKPKAVGVALVRLVEAVTDKGVTMEDLPAFLGLVTALQAAQGELATDTDASVLHIISGATNVFGDMRINPVLPTA